MLRVQVPQARPALNRATVLKATVRQDRVVTAQDREVTDLAIKVEETLEKEAAVEGHLQCR